MDSSSDALSSDEELQEEFLKGNLKPGLIRRSTTLKTYTNNVAGMRDKIAKLKEKELEWLERMDVTAATPESGLKSKGEEIEDESSIMDPEDDFKREMLFYHQAQSSVLIGLRKLDKLEVPARRPEDYYAEMVKTDDHMRRVRQCLLSRQKVLEQKEKARKMREQKKYGKKVQHEILQKRRQEKKATLEAVKQYKKGRNERPSFLSEEDHFPVTAEPSGEKGGAGVKKGPTVKGGAVKGWRPEEKSKKRALKDRKFGFGGKKRWSKSNTRESSADMSAFSATKHSRKTGGRSGEAAGKQAGKGNRRLGKSAGKGNQRLGKARRKFRK